MIKIESIDDESGSELLDQHFEEASKSDLISNENESSMGIQHGNNEMDGHKVQIKSEPNGEVKDEPIDEAIPMRRFMASEVDSNDRSKANDSDAKLKSRSTKKGAGKSFKSIKT